MWERGSRCSVRVTAILFLQVQHEVSNGNVVHRICSDACFTKFRATKGLKTNCCDYCGLYIYNKGMPVEYLFHEGQQKRFCNSSCLNSYKKVCGVSCWGLQKGGSSLGTQLLSSVWHRTFYAVAGSLNLLGLLLLTKYLKSLL